MKRLLALLLVTVLLTLLFCGCGDKKPTETTANPENVETAAPVNNTQPVIDYSASSGDPVITYDASSADSPLPTEPASAADPALSVAPASAADPAALVSPSAPSKPVKVYYDDSKYTPFRLPEAKYTRLREGPLTEFTPSNDYGAVVPYTAAPIFSKGGEGGWSGISGYHWGLMDKNGRILTDGIYVDVYPVEYVDYSGSSFNYETVTLPYWNVQTVENVRVIPQGDEDDTWNYTDGDMLHGLISMDGSFATPVKYVGIMATTECVIAQLDWSDAFAFDVFDLKGSKLFSGSDLPKRSTDMLELQYGEGTFLATYYYDNEHEACYFLDKTGKELLGPYERAIPFSDGLACVSTDGERYGYVDKTGSWVIEPKYAMAWSFKNGQAVQEENNRQFVIDKTGREIFSAPVGSYLNRTDFGYEADAYGEGQTRFYDRTGKEIGAGIVSSGEGWWSCLTGDKVTLSSDGSLTIRSVLDPDKSITAPGYYAMPAYALKDGKPVAGYEIVNYEQGQYTFVTEDLSQSWALTEAAPVDYGINGYRETRDTVTGKTIKAAADRGKIYCFDENDKLLGSFPNNTGWKILGGMLRTITDFACTYKDFSGKTVFCYPMDTILDD